MASPTSKTGFTAHLILWVLAAIVILTYLAIPFGPVAKQVPGVMVIHVWHPWAGDVADDFKAVVDRFNQTHKAVQVLTLFTPNDMANSTKFFIAVAGGIPPDITFVDGPQVAAWAEMGMLEPLDDFFLQAGIHEDDFWPPCWRQCHYRDHHWAITFVADPNFALIWNKQLFREVGLDPEKPPKTIQQLNEYCDRLTQFDRQGNMIRIGMIPWGTFYGGANSMYTWGWAFGGEFFDDKHNLVTADHPKNVAALTWMTELANKYGLNKVNSLGATFGSGPQDPFLMGKVAMQFMHVMGVQPIPRYAPDLEFGVGFLPSPPDGEKESSWVGGWTMAIPRDARNRRSPAQRDAARIFLKWMCASNEGTTYAAKKLHLFPGYRKCPYFDEIRMAPKGSDQARIYRPYLEILEKCKHQRPVMPAQSRYMFELDRAVSRTLFRQTTAAAALAEARRNTQDALDKILNGPR